MELYILQLSLLYLVVSYMYLVLYCHYFVVDIFTIVPTTQYVWLNQTATFECATNVTGYTLTLSIPAGVPLPNYTASTTDLSGGGKIAVVSFTVTSDNNGTSIRCIADDGFNIPLYTTLVYAYAQGIFAVTSACSLCM